MKKGVCICTCVCTYVCYVILVYLQGHLQGNLSDEMPIIMIDKSIFVRSNTIFYTPIMYTPI